MKKVIFILALGLFLPVASMAQLVADDPPVKIAVIDTQAIFDTSKAGVNIQEQIKKLTKNYQEEFGKQEDRLRGMDQELSKQRASLSPEEFTKKRRDFERAVADAQRDAQEKRRQLEMAVNKAKAELQGKIVAVVGKILEERKLTVVLARAQVFLAQRQADITKDVVAALDAQVTAIPVVIAPPAPKADKKTN